MRIQIIQCHHRTQHFSREQWPDFAHSNKITFTVPQFYNNNLAILARIQRYSSQMWRATEHCHNTDASKTTVLHDEHVLSGYIRGQNAIKALETEHRIMSCNQVLVSDSPYLIPLQQFAIAFRNWKRFILSFYSQFTIKNCRHV